MPAAKRQVDFAEVGASTKKPEVPSRKRARLQDPPKPKESENGAAKSAEVEDASCFYIVAGSYERILYGVQASISTMAETVDLQPIFSFPAHQSCVKAAASGQGSSSRRLWLATSSTDDTLKLWDLSRRKELGTLNAHDATVTSIAFVSDPTNRKASKFLLTSSDDGTLNLFRTKDWAVVRTFKGHKGPVNSVSVHPQGRIAISVGKDRTMRMWDLLGSQGQAMGGGKQGSNSTSLGARKFPTDFGLLSEPKRDVDYMAEANLIRWSSVGDKFAVLFDREVRLYSLDMRNLTTLTSKSKFHDVQFHSHAASAGETPSEFLLVACEDGKARVYNLTSTIGDAKKTTTSLALVAELTGHQFRIRCIELVNIRSRTFAVTISSDGFFHVYDLAELAKPTNADQVKTIAPKAKYSTKGSRLTCLSVITVSPDALQAITNAKGQLITLQSDSGSDEETDSDASSLASSLSDDDEDNDLLMGSDADSAVQSLGESSDFEGGEVAEEHGEVEEAEWGGIEDEDDE